MDRVSAMLVLLVVLVTALLGLLALFTVAPIFCSCLVSLLYSLYFFLSNEESGIHHAQEFENRFWTVFAILLSTAIFFASDSPAAFVSRWSPSLGFFSVLLSAFGMHAWDRHVHRTEISQQVATKLRRGATATSSLNRLQALGIPVEDQLAEINSCLRDIDQMLIPSTINNLINLRFVMRKEREIISIFQDCDARALNYLVMHVRLGLVFYKIKDHRNFSGQHRTELIQLLAVDRLVVLTVMSRVIVLHALQGLKLRANPRAEHWVRNILLSTRQDDLSELKTLTDAKGMYLDMNKLLYDDIKSETVRQDILAHIRREAAIQQAHMQMGTRRGRLRRNQAWRKVLSDVDDTLFCSGGSYPAGVDKRYGKKVVYPGVLGFYRELDLGTQGPSEWPDKRVGNLVFLSARPHFYKDVSEKHNFAKFEKLQVLAEGRKGMHTVPSLLAGDIASGRDYIVTNDMEPLALKKFDNFKRYVSIYPEYTHVFVCDNGQGDVRAGELMFDSFPYEFEAMYVHVVREITETHGYAPERWKQKGLRPCFFRTYPEAALDAATRQPPLIRVSGLYRVCHDAVKDFHLIQPKQWPSQSLKCERRSELNQAIWRANRFLLSQDFQPAPMIDSEQLWKDGEKVRTPYGIATIQSFDPVFDMYEVALDWRPLDVQVSELASHQKIEVPASPARENKNKALETVPEAEETEDPSTHNSEFLEPELIAESPQYDIIVPTPSFERLQDAEIDSDPDATITNSSPLKRESNVVHEREDGALSDSRDVDEKGKAESHAGDDMNGEIRNWEPIYARIHGRDISRYKPPTLPKLQEGRGSLFSFWGAESNKKVSFTPGDSCTTRYGPGTIVEYREVDSFVVVDMIGWHARACLQESYVTCASTGVLRRFMRQFSSGESGRKPAEFPFVRGTMIKTPFGESIVARPLPMNSQTDMSGATHQNRTIAAKDSCQTLCLSLTSWTLADESHPMLYCTVETARAWKDVKPSSRFLSNFGYLVSRGFRRLRPETIKREEQQLSPQFEQFYSAGAAVTTLYGDGVVRIFRDDDGFYEIDLTNWYLADNSNALAILQKDDISYRIAKGCHEGYPVLTSFGVSGALASVVPNTGIHIVTVPSAGMVCYLQPQDVIRPLKAATGEDVLTAYGEGRVLRYRLEDDMYVIRLKGVKATLYTKGETFDRVSDGMQDRDGAFGMRWLFQFFYPTDNKSQRSRSNSIISLSVRSQSGLSVT